MHSTREPPRTSLWSPWPTSSRGSHGLCCRVGTTISQQRTRLPHEVARKRRLRLGSASALPLYRTTTTNRVYPPRSAQEQRGRKNRHNVVSAAWNHKRYRKSHQPPYKVRQSRNSPHPHELISKH